MKVKTSELAGAALDWAVAKAQGWVDFPTDSGGGDMFWFIEPDKAPFGKCVPKEDFNPSASWDLGGLIIDRAVIGTWSSTGGLVWHARSGLSSQKVFDGPTPLIAAMRCYVESKLGDEVDVPNGPLQALKE